MWRSASGVAHGTYLWRWVGTAALLAAVVVAGRSGGADEGCTLRTGSLRPSSPGGELEFGIEIEECSAAWVVRSFRITGHNEKGKAQRKVLDELRLSDLKADEKVWDMCSRGEIGDGSLVGVGRPGEGECPELRATRVFQVDGASGKISPASAEGVVCSEPCDG